MNPPIPLLFGPYGSSALPYIGEFQRYSANALWFHGFNADAFEACARHTIAPCVEFKTFRADFGEHPELIPIGVDGKPIRYGKLVQGVCLSQQAFLDETEAALLDGLRAFQPVGIWLDYLTYAGWFEEPNLISRKAVFVLPVLPIFAKLQALTPLTQSRSWRAISKHGRGTSVKK